MGNFFSDLGKIFKRPSRKKDNNNDNNNNNNNNNNNIDWAAEARKQQAEIEAALKEAERKAEEARKEAERKAEISRQSSKAQQQSILNQGEINQQVQSKLNTPIVGQGQTQPTQYQASGAGVSANAGITAKQNAVKSVGGAVPEQPIGAIVSKINEESGGTSRPQNFNQPNYQNLQFGGA